MDYEKLVSIKKRDFLERHNSFADFSHIASELILGEHFVISPLVTIVIPTYHRVKELKKAVTSALNQRFDKSFQVLVVSNNTDYNHEEEVVNMLREFADSRLIYYRNQENLYAAGNWNRCIELAQSKWICMLHDDDILHPDNLSLLFSSLDNNQNIDFLSTGMEYIDASDMEHELHFLSQTFPQKATVEQVFFTDYIRSFKGLLLGGIFKKACAIEMGGFFQAKGVSSVEDRFFMCRFSYYYNVFRISYRTYGYGWGENASINIQIWQTILVNEFYFASQINSMVKGMTRLKNMLFIDVYGYLVAHNYNSKLAQGEMKGSPLDYNLLFNECGFSPIKKKLVTFICNAHLLLKKRKKWRRDRNE